MGLCDFLPRLLPWQPKSFLELEIDFDTRFEVFWSWCTRRSIPEIRQNIDILPKAMPIAPDQDFFDGICQVATMGGFFEDGQCFMSKSDHSALLLTATLDTAAKLVLASPGNGIQKSESPAEFNVAPCNVMMQGMEAWGVYQTPSPTGNPYLMALYLPPGFCRDDTLEAFIAITHLSREPGSRFGSTSPYEQPETMWSLLLDSCVSSRCTSFVVSSYDRWVFGEFTTDFSSATISSILDRSSIGPSVPEALYQWIGHAFEMAQLQKDLSVGAIEQDEWPLTFKDLQMNNLNRKLMSLWDIQ